MARRLVALRPMARRLVARRLVARRPVAAFLVMVYVIVWSLFLPTILQDRGLLALPLDLSEGLAFNALVAVATILGVALPAFLVTAATGGESGVRDYLDRCLSWRVGVGWYLVALLGFLAATVLVGSASLGPAPLQALVREWPLLFKTPWPQERWRGA